MENETVGFVYLNIVVTFAGGMAVMFAELTMKRYGLGLLIASAGGPFFLLALVFLLVANASLHRDLVSEGLAVSLRQDGSAVVAQSEGSNL
jgi:hypothetical protein